MIKNFLNKYRGLARMGLAIGLLTSILTPFFYTYKQEKIAWIFMVIGLVITFLSLTFYLPLTKQAFSSRKGKRYFNSWISTFLFFFILLAIYLCFYFELLFIQFDFSKDKIFSLSPQTMSVLKRLDVPVEVKVFDTRDDNNPTHRMLALYDQTSEFLEVTYIDTHKNPLLAKKYQISQRGNYVFISEKTEPVILNNNDLIQRIYDAEGKEKLELRHEEKITSTLYHFVDAKKSYCYFLTGHGERDIRDVSGNGLNRIKEVLTVENMIVETLDLRANQSIPEKAEIIVIAGAKTKFTKNEIDLLDDFLVNQGSLFVLLDPILDSRGVDVGLDELLSKYGFVMHNNVVIDSVNFFQLKKNYSRKIESFPFLPILNYGKHSIVRELEKKHLNTVFFSTRSLEKKTGLNDDFKYSLLLETLETAYGEVSLKEFDNSPKYDKDKDYQGPLGVGAVMEFPSGKTNRRLAVYGDSGFIANHVVDIGGHKDLFINTVRWLLNEDKKLSIRPKTITFNEIYLPLRQKQIALTYFLLLQPGGILIGGLFLIYRRKRKK